MRTVGTVLVAVVGLVLGGAANTVLTEEELPAGTRVINLGTPDPGLLHDFFHAIDSDDASLDDLAGLAAKLEKFGEYRTGDQMRVNAMKALLTRANPSPEKLRTVVDAMPSILSPFRIDLTETGEKGLERNPLMSCVEAGYHECVRVLTGAPHIWKGLEYELRQTNPGEPWTAWAQLLRVALERWSQKVWFANLSPMYPHEDVDATVAAVVDAIVAIGDPSRDLHITHVFLCIDNHNLNGLTKITEASPTLARRLLSRTGKRASQLAVDVSGLRIMVAKMLTGHQQGLYQGPADESVPKFDSLEYVGLGDIKESLNRDFGNNTLLHDAAHHGNWYATAVLLTNFDPERLGINDRNNNGVTALDMARYGGYVEVQRLLMEHGAVPTSLDGEKDGQPAQSCMADMEGCLEPLDAPLTREPRPPNKNPVDEARGGWNTDRMEDLDIDFCDFDIRYNLSEEELFEEYMKWGKPVIVRDDSILEWPAFSNWNLQRWNSTIRDSKLKVYEKHGTDRPRSFEMTLGEYFDYMEEVGGKERTPLWMHDTAWPRGQEEAFAADVKDITLVSRASQRFSGKPQINNFQLMIAPRYSGSPPHIHYNAANVLVYGRKRWFMFPPAKSVYSTIQTTEWIEKNLNKMSPQEKPFECVQEPGDLFFVPDGWGHGTVSIQDTIGFALLYTPGRE